MQIIRLVRKNWNNLVVKIIKYNNHQMIKYEHFLVKPSDYLTLDDLAKNRII